jgi:hypothetical protein
MIVNIDLELLDLRLKFKWLHGTTPTAIITTTTKSKATPVTGREGL